MPTSMAYVLERQSQNHSFQLYCGLCLWRGVELRAFGDDSGEITLQHSHFLFALCAKLDEYDTLNTDCSYTSYIFIPPVIHCTVPCATEI